MALLIAIGGALAIARTPIDIFPSINIPVVTVIWQFAGLSPNEMEGRVVTIGESSSRVAGSSG
jgi:multidrug efflux pump subunit AcrB